eukprot:scaffold66251_cov43-Prasinocladus_malaysianus.AAC.1
MSAATVRTTRHPSPRRTNPWTAGSSQPDTFQRRHRGYSGPRGRMSADPASICSRCTSLRLAPGGTGRRRPLGPSRGPRLDRSVGPPSSRR